MKNKKIVVSSSEYAVLYMTALRENVSDDSWKKVEQEQNLCTLDPVH